MTLVLLYGGVRAGLDGIIALAAAFSCSAKLISTWWLVVIGLLGVGAGIVTFCWPGMSAIVLVLFIGAWAAAHGIFEIIGAIQLRKQIENEWAPILGGFLSVIFGVVILIAPGAGALALVWAIAAYSIVFGLLLMAFSLRLRTHRHPVPLPALHKSGSRSDLRRVRWSAGSAAVLRGLNSIASPIATKQRLNGDQHW